MRRLIPLLVVNMFFSLACGDDGGTPVVDAAPEADADLSCDSPDVVVGMPCQVEGQSCGGPCTDACSFCNLTVCSNGEWTQVEVFPAPCFSCGAELQCQASQSYCHITHPDVAGEPDTYECVDMPAACSADPSCQCVGNEVVYDACTGDPGQITVETSGG